VALMILYVAGGMVWNGIRELIDTGVEPDRLAAMKETIANVEGVVDAHEVRTRLMGSDIYLDGHVRVDPKVSVSEGHRIGEAVRQRLTEEFKGIADITIHVDSEDDEAYQRSDKLPLRSQLERRLLDRLRHIPEAQRIDNLIFHYLNGRIQAEIWLPLSQFQSIEQAEETADKIRRQLVEDETVQRIDVLFN
jgi:divalent metal cation (Fe/Co/Zn/Cd) transporter